MALNFLPGQPNYTQQTVCQSSWQDHTLLTYCSGNNLIILSNDFSRLQTLYFDNDCVAVDIDASSGHIAVAAGPTVIIYKPLHRVMKNPRWVFCTKIFHDESRVNTISWGLNGDLAIGSDYLSFWKIRDEFGHFEPSLLWTKKQFHPVYRCAVSEDSQVIASMHKYSHTVRLWKRISLGDDRELFDLTLISHPDFVTSFRWKHSNNLCDKEKNSHVFYTLCADSKLRIWSYHETNGRKTVQQWGELELDAKKDQKFCLLLDSWLVQKALQGSDLGKTIYYTQIHPDIAVLASKSGQLEFYALENLSHDPPKLMNHKLIASTVVAVDAFVYNPEFLYFAEPQILSGDTASLSLIVHDLKGVLRHSSLNLQNVLSTRNEAPAKLLHKYTGHNKSIQKLIRSSDGKAMISMSRFAENCIWVPQTLSTGVSLRKKNIIYSESPLIDAVVLESGSLVVTLSKNVRLQAWNCSSSKGSKDSQLKAEYNLDPLKGAPRLMLNTPEKKHRHDRHYIALIYPSGDISGFLISFNDGIVPVSSNALDISGEKSIYLISAIDPVNYGFFANRSLISLIDKNGLIKTFKCVVNEDQLKWKLTFQVQTNLRNTALISGSSIDKICVVDELRKRLTIWDLRTAFLEYEKNFDEQIRDIDWTSTKFHQSIFSAGFSDHVLLFTQQRYDYTSKIPSYSPVAQIELKEHTTHSVGDSIWLTDGTFVAASGNQLFIKDKHLDTRDKFTNQSIGSRRILSNDIMHLSSVLNGPLPVYHPQLLIQSLYTGKLKLVKEILLRLFLTLRALEFNSNDVAELGATLGISYEKFICPNEESYITDSYSEPYNEFNSLVSCSLREKLVKHALPFITRHQQATLITVIEAVEDIEKNKQALDLPGMLFILGLKLFELHRKTQKSINVRDALWSLYSKNKKVLFSSVLPNIDSWERARQYKISYWVEHDDLVASFDKIAKHAFSKGAERDPKNSGLFYLALKKKQVLLGLWRISAGHPEQHKMLKFLGNDFREERWRKAALKNAFVLLSKHRFIDAACFFLLADSLKDAANVILKQLDDLALALGVCRLYEGDYGPVSKDILLSCVLPEAILNNDRWITSFIYHALEKPNLALKALVMPPIDLDDNKSLVRPEDMVSRSFLVEDPALLMLFRHVRRKDKTYLNAAAEVDETWEYKTIQKVAAIYCRMGCDYLALSLVANWKFQDKTNKRHSKLHLETDRTGDLNGNTTEGKPQKLRSIFDKFDDMSRQTSGATLEPIKDSTNAAKPKNLLDGFNSSDQGSAQTYFQQNNESGTDLSINSPDIVGTDHNGYTSATTPTSFKTQNAISNESSKFALPSKPRNLLDDFF
ncbi:LANO_0G16358g1_1 [Lachancea nothofagi CBS 11611]|uniref:LANO_0G16358g1_1 n=1 Tax=Lachancea nothofagi CBS 11611 TaxID=1266666 RepID=A0A1G4KKR1_9SACH|nr:LANO_0G16358g1_1 [Lachancea nothofagi CBS 11611]